MQRNHSFILLIALPLLFAILASAQHSPKAQLRVRLAVDRASYRLDGEIHLDAVRENTGNCDLFIYRRWEWGGPSRFRVFDANGAEVKTVMYAVDDPPPLTSSDFVLLHPGESLKTQVKRKMTEFVKVPGNYEFSIEYSSYLPEDLARKYIPKTDVPFWSAKQGTVTSNRIKLRVTE